MPCSIEDVRRLAVDLLDPLHFHGDWPLTCQHDSAERLRWEVFQGRLVDEAHTRQECTFESWNIHHDGDDGMSPAPVLSLKLDTAAGVVHVVRGVEGYAWEGYEAEGAILSRERRKWQRELIASFSLSLEPEAMRDELASALGRAVTGTRLPLTPVEAPLPAFSFGLLWYDPGDAAESRALEFQLRSRPVWEVVAEWERRPAADVLHALRGVYLDVSLSPFTDFVYNAGQFLLRLLEKGTVADHDVIDFESWLLRLVARHVTAYDLVTFHHRGANYPDALLLKAVLDDYIAWAAKRPDLFAGDAVRLRRRALRQAYLLRRECEGLPVPDVPTSPGEHARVYPASHPRVPEEQVLQPARRRLRLFADYPLLLPPPVQEILAEAVRDLRYPEEAEELGVAVYLDRPFGGAKGPVERDGTPLLASLAYSRAIATRRLRLLGEAGEAPELPGIGLEHIGVAVRPNTLSLSDAARVASDFVFRRTLPRSILTLTERFDALTPHLHGRVVVARSTRGPGLVVYDETWRSRLEFEPCLERGYASRRGVEWPTAGIRVTRVYDLTR